jgi:hypothetical protein
MSFLSEYRKGFDWLASMFPFDACLLFATYNSLIAQRDISGPTLEIGVHHGASAIAIAALRKRSEPFVAIDLFSELQDQNVSKSGSGDREIFLANMRHFHGDTNFIRVIASPSSTVTASQLGEGYSFCHIDGGHSDRETYGDLLLCSEIAAPGGLIALDDCFNPNFPGVSEGTVRFMLENRGKLRPVAVGYNKVLFQREPVTFDINAAFADQFAFIPRAPIEHFGCASFLFAAPLEYFFDLAGSSLTQFIRRQEVIRAGLTPETKEVRARPNQTCSVPIRVGNESTIPFQWSDSPIGLSYHLKTFDGRMLVHDNVRTFFREPLFPGQERVVNVSVAAPATAGSYQLEFDLVWESILWFKDRGSPTTSIPLVVS